MEIYEFLKNESGLPFTLKTNDNEDEIEFVDASFDHEFGREIIKYLTVAASGHLYVTIGAETHAVEYEFVYSNGNKTYECVRADGLNFYEFASIESDVMAEIDDILEDIKYGVKKKSERNPCEYYD